MRGHLEPRPVGGRVFEPFMATMLALFGVGAAVILYRVIVGVGPVSNMTDGFTWGIWEPVNVVVFTGIGAGAFGVGLLCYLLNRGEYHPLVRPAVLLGAISYTLGGASIMVALGRYWNSYLLPFIPIWNLNSNLLEVAICVMLYTGVLWVEVLPAILETAARSSQPTVARWGATLGRWVGRAMPYFIALALLLPTMHQSSLGGLMLIAGPKIHPLWHTALLPALFLVSCLSMGYGAVVVLTTLLHRAWNAAIDDRLLGRMSKVNGALLLGYAVVRVGDVALSGKLRYLRADGYGALFLLELALFVAPALMFFSPRVRANRGRLFGAALLTILAGALYRVDTYLGVYRPAPGWNYVPSFGELTVTIGMAAVGVAVFVFVARKFPVVVLADAHAPSHASAAAARSTAASR